MSIQPELEAAQYIVLIEDDDLVRLSLETALNLIDRSFVVSFSSGEAALAYLSTFTGSIGGVVTDIHLPGINGCDVIQTIKNLPAWLSLPIIAVSGDPSPQLEGYAIRSGADLFIRKPCSPSQLRKTLEKLIYAKGQTLPPEEISREDPAASPAAADDGSPKPG